MLRFARNLFIALSALGVVACAAPVAKTTPQETAITGDAAQKFPRIVLYSAAWCPHCKEAKEYFTKNNIPFVNRDVEEDSDAMQDLMEKYQLHAVPLIVIGDDAKLLKGFNREEFEKALKEVQEKK
jgi:glutaredoxin-like YruB-family protein